jgi:predicted PurR-regulated permease PerM
MAVDDQVGATAPMAPGTADGRAVADAAPARVGATMARWSARALLIAAGVALVGGITWYARAATVPLIVAALVATQLVPLAGWLTGRGLSRGLAIAATMLAFILAAAGLAWIFTDSLFGNVGAIGQDISKGADQVIVWLREHDDWVRQHEEAIRDFLAGLLPTARKAAGGLASGLLGGLSVVAQVISGAVLMVVFLLYILTGGGGVWRWVEDRFGDARRDRVAAVGEAGWNAATGYVRGIALVAFIDTVVITLGMLVIGTPHVLPLALLSLVTLFIPILGAWVSGTVIVLVTLAAQGVTLAAVMAVVILAAQQLDSMFVTPLVYQKTVNLHPIVTLTAVIVGSQLLGIVGAFLAVPLVAVLWAVFKVVEARGS